MITKWKPLKEITSWKANVLVIGVCVFVAWFGWWAASLTGG